VRDRSRSETNAEVEAMRPFPDCLLLEFLVPTSACELPRWSA
jgi:hypothetical protein